MQTKTWIVRTDYQYIKYGTIPLTIEMSCNKFGPYQEVEKIVEHHKNATLEFLKTLKYGENFFKSQVSKF